MPEIVYRPALLEDSADIHALLLRLAPEIPLLVDTLEREEALYALVRNCARSGQSWVAVDGEAPIVGFVLAEPNQTARHYAEHEIIELHYAGVAPDHRDHGIFTVLIAKLLARMVPVTTTVPPLNRSQTARRLEHLHFRRTDAPGGEPRLRWDPGGS